MSGNICFKGPNKAIQSLFSQTKDFSRFRLTLNLLWNSITSPIMGCSLCMSTTSKSKICRPSWRTPCLVWYSGVLVIVGIIPLSGQLFWILTTQVPFSTYKGTSNIWIQVSKWVNLNSYSSISCEDGILENLSVFPKMVWTPLKFQEYSNLNLFQNL
jgi:hypothetical protein